MNISVIGLGKLGLCTASCFAMKGHITIGLDKSDFIINELNDKRCPINETNLPEVLDKAWSCLSVTKDMKEAIFNSEITLIITPTPSKEDGSFNNDYVMAVLEEIAPLLKEKKERHIIDVVSTVMPGSCNDVFIPFLEKATGKLSGKDFGFVYNPEFIALGSVIRNFLNPDMVLIGASDNLSADMVERLYLESCENKPMIHKMSLINSEITKISLNCYVTMKISYANELAGICEKVPGADVDVITAAIGADTRIGSKYLKGGLGFGGPCFPRDNIAFQVFAENYGAQATLGMRVVAINHGVIDRIIGIMHEYSKHGGRISILGMSYKPETHVIEESQSIELAQKCIDLGYSVAVHDPASLHMVEQVLGGKVQLCHDIYDCVKKADIVIVMTRWPEYENIDLDTISELMSQDAVLIDCWRIFRNTNNKKINYRALGFGKRE